MNNPTQRYMDCFELRDYQRELCSLLLEGAAAEFRRASSLAGDTLPVSPLVYLPTGAGKTRTAVAFLLSCLQRGLASRVGFLVNRKQLLDQAAEALQAGADLCGLQDVDGLPARVGRICGGSTDETGAAITVASVQALLARGAKLESGPDQVDDSALDPWEGGSAQAPSERAPSSPTITLCMKEQLESERPFDVVVVDEAHGAYARGCHKLLADFRAAGTFVVGLTATPIRTKVSRWRSSHSSSLLPFTHFASLAGTGHGAPRRSVFPLAHGAWRGPVGETGSPGAAHYPCSAPRTYPCKSFPTSQQHSTCSATRRGLSWRTWPRFH